MGDLQAAGEGVHAADVGVEQVDRLEAFAADLGVEVDAAGGEAAVLQQHEHALRRQIDVGRELVGVPAEQQVAGVGVDRAQDARRRRRLPARAASCGRRAWRGWSRCSA